jgi:hypothetical protein
MDPDQTARMRRLVWIHAGRKRIMLVLSWRGSFQEIDYDNCDRPIIDNENVKRQSIKTIYRLPHSF